ncbi:MAG: sigma-E processing peptidase SpoIIGA, partial [Clostridia bacterium]|nr:sigma-E processing peptidase SpoIIGA [Clostridia bacterium]
MPVYVDVLLAVNGFINFLLLESAKKILRINCGNYRLFFSAAAGALFSLKIFLPDMVFALDIAARFMMCAAMSLIAFGFGGAKGFLKKMLTFFAVNLFYGGFMSAVFSLINPNGMIYKNGAVYFDIDFKILAL